MDSVNISKVALIRHVPELPKASNVPRRTDCALNLDVAIVRDSNAIDDHRVIDDIVFTRSYTSATKEMTCSRLDRVGHIFSAA